MVACLYGYIFQGFSFSFLFGWSPFSRLTHRRSYRQRAHIVFRCVPCVLPAGVARLDNADCFSSYGRYPPVESGWDLGLGLGLFIETFSSSSSSSFRGRPLISFARCVFLATDLLSIFFYLSLFLLDSFVLGVQSRLKVVAQFQWFHLDLLSSFPFLLFFLGHSSDVCCTMRADEPGGEPFSYTLDDRCHKNTRVSKIKITKDSGEIKRHYCKKANNRFILHHINLCGFILLVVIAKMRES